MPVKLRYGYAQGNLVGSSTHVLDGMRKLVNKNGFVRTDAKWTPGSPLPVAAVQPLAAAISARGMLWFACLHGVIKGGGVYQYPTDYAQWRSECHVTARSLIQQGVRNFSIMNEPNTPTGNVGGKMTPVIAANLVNSGALGVRDALKEQGVTGQVFGPGLGSIDIAYLNQMYAALPAFLIPLTGLDVHVYMSEAPSLPGGTQFPRRIRTLEILRQWLDGKGFNSKNLRITEGGYASSSQSPVPPNVLTNQMAAQYTQQALAYLKQNAATLRFSLVCFYNPIDNGTTKYSGPGYDYTFWYQKLGTLNQDLSYKATGVEFAKASGVLV
jgi:hypothetical protein